MPCNSLCSYEGQYIKAIKGAFSYKDVMRMFNYHAYFLIFSYTKVQNVLKNNSKVIFGRQFMFQSIPTVNLHETRNLITIVQGMVIIAFYIALK